MNAESRNRQHFITKPVPKNECVLSIPAGSTVVELHSSNNI